MNIDDKFRFKRMFLDYIFKYIRDIKFAKFDMLSWIIIINIVYITNFEILSKKMGAGPSQISKLKIGEFRCMIDVKPSLNMTQIWGEILLNSPLCSQIPRLFTRLTGCKHKSPPHKCSLNSLCS